MKKRLFACLLLAVLLLLALPLSARAEARLDYVNDYAGILADGSRQSLNDRAAQISRAYDCGVYIVVVDDYRDYVNGGIEDFSEAIYKEYELGEGEAKDGILLAMSMDDRDYDITAYGDFANYAFTDYGKDQLASTMLDNFRADDWAGGFADFIDNAGTLIQRAKNGDPLDQWIPDPPAQYERQHGMTPMKWLISLLFPSLVGGATVSGMARRMKTAVKQTRAEEYVGKGSPRLSVSSDQFINRSVTRQIIPKNNGGNRPSGGHYGGTTVNSGGFSHHSGKF